jgi:putative aldouronate transport system substrate-binding protein
LINWQASNNENIGRITSSPGIYERRQAKLYIPAQDIPSVIQSNYQKKNKGEKKMNKFVHQILFAVLVLSMVLSACAPATTPAPVPTTEEATAAPDATAAPAETAKPADGPYAGYDAPTTITVVRKFESTEKLPQGDTESDNQFTRYLLKNFNIDVKFLWVSAVADYDQKINLAIASNDLPDAMVVNLAQFSQMVKND